MKLKELKSELKSAKEHGGKSRTHVETQPVGSLTWQHLQCKFPGIEAKGRFEGVVGHPLLGPGHKR